MMQGVDFFNFSTAIKSEIDKIQPGERLLQKASNQGFAREVRSRPVSGLQARDRTAPSSRRLEILHYGDMRADLERKGTMIGVNDLHIAGYARSRGLILVSNNTLECERVEGLRILDWTDTAG